MRVNERERKTQRKFYVLVNMQTIQNGCGFTHTHIPKILLPRIFCRDAMLLIFLSSNLQSHCLSLVPYYTLSVHVYLLRLVFDVCMQSDGHIRFRLSSASFLRDVHFTKHNVMALGLVCSNIHSFAEREKNRSICRFFFTSVAKFSKIFLHFPYHTPDESKAITFVIKLVLKRAKYS